MHRSLGPLTTLFLLMFAAATPASAQGAARDSSLRLHRAVSTENAYDANAWWIETPRGLVLIDALLTRSDARALVAAMQSSGKPLVAAFLTHPHADHFGGLSTVKAAFPQATIVATRATADGIQPAHERGMRDGWLAAYGDDYDRQPLRPDRLVASGDTLTFAGVAFIVRDYGPVEASNNSVIHVPALRAVFTGDATVSGASYYLGEGHGLDAMQALPRLLADHPGVDQAYAGHYGAQNLRVVVEENLEQLRHAYGVGTLVLSDSAAVSSGNSLTRRAQSMIARALAVAAQGRQDYGVGAAGMATINVGGLVGSLRGDSLRAVMSPRDAALRRALRRLMFLIGRWPDAEFGTGLGGLYIDGRAESNGFRYQLSFSYDVMQGRYRVSSRDQRSGLLDIFEGDFDAEGRLVVDNRRTGTHYRGADGRPVHTRMTLAPRADGSWTWTVDSGASDGAWTRILQVTMTRLRIE